MLLLHLSLSLSLSFYVCPSVCLCVRLSVFRFSVQGSGVSLSVCLSVSLSLGLPLYSILAAHGQSKCRLKTLAIEISLVPAVEFAPQDVVAHLGFAPQKTKVYTTLGFALPNFQQLQFLKLDGNMIASEDEVVMLMRGLKAWPRQHFLHLDSNVHAWINLPDAFEIPERSHDANIATFMAQVGSWPEKDRGIHVISQKRCWLEMSPHYDVLNLPAETFGCGNVAVQQLLRCVVDKHARATPCSILHLSCIGNSLQLIVARHVRSAASMCSRSAPWLPRCTLDLGRILPQNRCRGMP